MKRRLAEANPEIRLTFHVFESDIRDTLVRERLMATLSGFFGFLAAVLAVIGLYGVMSYMVQRRTNEIGIRMALGAGRVSILSMILRDAFVLLGVGIVVGLGLSVALGKTTSSLAVRSEACRSNHARDGGGSVGCRGCSGQLHSSAARLEGRSNGSVTLRIIFANQLAASHSFPFLCSPDYVAGAVWNPWRQLFEMMDRIAKGLQDVKKSVRAADELP